VEERVTLTGERVVKPLDEIANEIKAAVEAVLAANGLTLDGEVRGVLAVRGQPESGTGFGVDLGEGLPQGWK
jgi:hypothetical protein